MKKFALLLIGLFLVLGMNGCAEVGDDGDMYIRTLYVGTEIADTAIASGGTHFYKFRIYDAGSYTIGLRNLDSDFSWSLYFYDSNYYSDYEFVTAKASCNDSSSTANEVKTVFFEPGLYLLMVDERDNYDSFYDLLVD